MKITKYYLITTVTFAYGCRTPSYECSRLCTDAELSYTDYKLPRQVGQSISRIECDCKENGLDLIVDTITRVK